MIGIWGHACKLVGTMAVPFTKSAQAVSAVTKVFGGAPAEVSAPGSPLPSHLTMSSSWQKRSMMVMSAWQAAGQLVAVAARQLGFTPKAPATTVVASLAAVCVYVTAASNASAHAPWAKGSCALLMTRTQSLVALGTVFASRLKAA